MPRPGPPPRTAPRAPSRPTGAADFNGTVVVEWLNVSGGSDAAPDWKFLTDELVRTGTAWVGVSAQRVGVEGGPVAVSATASTSGSLAGRGLRAADPERYGTLAHPGDGFAYDIYTQVARAVRTGADDVLGGAVPDRVLAVGESQSAFALTTDVNGVQPSTGAFDGFLLHSRGGPPLPLGEAGGSVDIAAALVAGTPTIVRTDTAVPVLVLVTETDLVSVIGYLPARQDDTDRIRTWEVAGTAHADRTLLGPVADQVGCGVLSGDPGPTPSVICLLLGSTTPLPAERLVERYGDRAGYLAAYRRATSRAVRRGWVLPADRAELLAAAAPDRLPG